MSSGKHDQKTHQSTEKKPKKKRHPFRILLVLILLLVAAAAGAVTYLYKTAEASLDLKFAQEKPSVEFGAECPAMDYVSEWTGDIAPSQASLDTDSLGEKAISYTVSQPILRGMFTPSREFTLDYTVVDTVAPVKLWSGDGALVQAGTKFDIQNYISYGDNADPSPEVRVDGKVNTKEEGSYPLHVTVTDSSGNSTGWDLTVSVVETMPEYEEDEERTPFKDFCREYAGGGRSFGIDVSDWQDEIDFKKVRKAGCEFVIIRIGWSDEGKMTVDNRFGANLVNAKKAGIKVGVYMYSYDNSEEKVRSSAAQLIEKLDGESLDLPVAFDWEDFGNFQTYGMNFADLNRLYDAFADVMSQNGYGCMLYSSKAYLEKVWEDTDIRPVWLAHYTDKTDYKGPYMIWQNSCTGKIKGIKTAVDFDILYHY